MKVKELIRQLKKYDPEARVYNNSWMGKGTNEVLCSVRYIENGDVILEDKTQFDVKEEIRGMFEYYLLNDYDETDAYQDMVDRGYTPEIVSYYYNDDAGRVMKIYCNEHGIE